MKTMFLTLAAVLGLVVGTATIIAAAAHASTVYLDRNAPDAGHG
jgi:hypothetical protein